MYTGDPSARITATRPTGSPIRYAYSSIGGQVHTRLRSPYALSTLATGGQYLCSRSHGAGKAACSREYGRSHSVPATAAAVCGAFLSGLFARSIWPLSIAAISARIEIIASQNRSSSALLSLSVGSTISVPGTGNDIVGAWKP